MWLLMYHLASSNPMESITESASHVLHSRIDS
jgi:hypothetical protein